MSKNLLSMTFADTRLVAIDQTLRNITADWSRASIHSKGAINQLFAILMKTRFTIHRK